MELYAATQGLEALKEPCQVTLYSDSEYLVNAMSKGWAARWKQRGWMRNSKERALNPDLWERLLALCEKHQVTFVWLRGHTGIPENERCDQLCPALRKICLPMMVTKTNPKIRPVASPRKIWWHVARR
jgi:ribonuclease HI